MSARRWTTRCVVAGSMGLVALAATSPVEPSHAAAGEPAPRWGEDGHVMAARAAHASLPRTLPNFFLDAGERLAYLNPEPDRWREREMRAMDQGWNYDHYIDLERVPEGALDATDRFAFLRALYDAGIERPEQAVGLLPYRILELYERLVQEWRLWSRETDPDRRHWIEQRIIDDAGILGHYVTDASQPHHTTIHFNGWDADTPNPNGYTRDRGFHARFESAFVAAHIEQEMISARVGPAVTLPDRDTQAVVISYIQDTFQGVERLYQLDRDVGFAPDQPAHAAAGEFAAERLAAGATILASMWLSAWEAGTR